MTDDMPTAHPRGGPADSLGFLLARVGAWASQRYAGRLAPLGVEPRHAAILRIVATTGGASQQELADRLGVPPSRMVGLIDELEARGIVRRERNPDDRRAYVILLTESGRELGKQLARIGRDHERDVTRPLSDTEREQLRELLTRLSAEQDLPPDAYRP